MAKVFTITEGLQNMGALRTGGQGSVYKAKRTGEIIVAVKLLPTPVEAENDEDKNYKSFRNEVAKLKKVNEVPNPHVVKILNSGITESGSFPFIEMEFIEGPDLAELLTPPHDTVFTIAEIIKVADQLANALSHCHTNGIRHGDIKSNNVKCNSQTGNYILLDFGLAVMSDEQRRSSLQHAGAVEFMAPEQSEGVLSFQSDVYSYGIILYELLAGSVPFPLKDNGHSARNAVMISHLEAPLPDALQLRKQHLPATWSAEKKATEMQVPDWLLNLILKCLEKNQANRFASGIELYQAIIRQKSGLTAKNDIEGALILQNENERLQKALAQQQDKAKDYEEEIALLRQALSRKEQELTTLQGTATIPHTAIPRATIANSGRSVKRGLPVWLTMLALLLGIGAFAAYFITRSGSAEKDNTVSLSDSVPHRAVYKKPVTKKRSRAKHTAALPDTTVRQSIANHADTSAVVIPAQIANHGKVYTVAVKFAYFHNAPDAGSIRKANINIWNNARLTALSDKDGYIYVVYTNEKGQVSRGWLNKNDLREVR